MLIWNLGASFGLTLFRNDLIDYVEADIPVKNVTKINRVIGIGNTIHKFKMTKGRISFFTVSLTIYPKQRCKFYLPKHITKCMEDTPC